MDLGTLTSITIPASVTSINAFRDCTGLTNVTFAAGSQLETIGERAFRGCTSLTSITIPASVTKIGEGAFRGCTSLTSVSFAAGFSMSIDGWFSGLSSLTTVNIPAGVTSIGPRAFSGCTGLTSITIPASVTEIGGWAFSGCTGLTSITVDGNNQNYASEGGILYNKAKTELIVAPPAGISGNITIPASVTTIYDGAFNCTGLTGITIPEGVTSIGSSAFSGCTNLRNIIIDTDKVPCFYKDNWRTRFPADNLSVTFKKDVGDYAFYTNVGMGVIERSNLTSVTLDEGVTSIGSLVFEGWSSPQTIYVPWTSGNKPSGWASSWWSYNPTWSTSRATIVYQGGQ